MTDPRDTPERTSSADLARQLAQVTDHFAAWAYEASRDDSG